MVPDFISSATVSAADQAARRLPNPLIIVISAPTKVSTGDSICAAAGPLIAFIANSGVRNSRRMPTKTARNRTISLLRRKPAKVFSAIARTFMRLPPYVPPLSEKPLPANSSPD
jgi:hypothetical protein